MRERDKQEVHVFAWTGMDDDLYTWGARTAIRAAVYPGGEKLERRVYGECSEDTAVMLYDGETPIETGMGVSLDGGLPSFRIVRVERWAHTRATLERIPGRERTHGGGI